MTRRQWREPRQPCRHALRHGSTAWRAVRGGKWHDLTVGDGTIRLNLGQVVYVRTARDEHRVGFGAD